MTPGGLRWCTLSIHEGPTYGEQEGSAYNGHFGCTCYHPLFVFNQLGDVERCHGRYVTFQIAEVAAPRQMFQEILSFIARLRAPPAPV
jgi:hypothetical protein